ncbi:MAG: hypothetical protein ABI051_16300 [Vicinamibacterales bacterium]
MSDAQRLIVVGGSSGGLLALLRVLRAVGGTLRETPEHGLIRFECHVGHVFNEDGMLHRESEILDQALWTALRALEESADLRRRIARDATARGMATLAREYQERGAELEARAGLVRAALTAVSATNARESLRPRTRRSASRSTGILAEQLSDQRSSNGKEPKAVPSPARSRTAHPPGHQPETTPARSRRKRRQSI